MSSTEHVDVDELSASINNMSISVGTGRYPDNSTDSADIEMLMQALDGSSSLSLVGEGGEPNPTENEALDYFDNLFTSLGGEAPRSSFSGSLAGPSPTPTSVPNLLPPPPPLPSAAEEPPAERLVGGGRKPTLKLSIANKVFAIEHDQHTDRHQCIEGVISAEYRNTFYDRYWRNKRHNVQCFPKDEEYGDYCNWLMQPKESKGDLGAAVPVVVDVRCQPSFLIPESNTACLSHIIPLSARGVSVKPGDSPTTVGGLNEFTKRFTAGSRVDLSSTNSLCFKTNPKLWKYSGALPKKRKQGTDYRLCLETMILGAMQGTDQLKPMTCIAILHSPPFELGSTRTLMRLKAKQKEKMRAPNDISARNPQVKRAAHGTSSSLATEQPLPEAAFQKKLKVEFDV